MNVKWFKERQKEVGVTADEIAGEIGRARSGVSHIYSGHQRMSLEWAQAFAKALQVPVEIVLEQAGVTNDNATPKFKTGLSDSDVAPYRPTGGDAASTAQIVAALGGAAPHIDTYEVRTAAMSLAGYLPGDLLLMDRTKSELSKAGDSVIAEVYSWKTGQAELILRRFDPPVLVAQTGDISIKSVYVPDGTNVVIRGKVMASWRKSSS